MRIGGMKRFFLSLTILLAASATISAQDAEQQAAAKKKKATSGELFETIARADTAVFDAFNAHDVTRLMALFTDDLEFYDDGDGAPKGASQVKEDFENLFASVPDYVGNWCRERWRFIRSKAMVRSRWGNTAFAMRRMGRRIAALRNSQWCGDTSATNGSCRASQLRALAVRAS